MHFLRSGAHGLVEILSVFSTCRFGSSTSPVDIPCSFDFPSALWSILCLFILLLNGAQHPPPPSAGPQGVKILPLPRVTVSGR